MYRYTKIRKHLPKTVTKFDRIFTSLKCMCRRCLNIQSVLYFNVNVLFLRIKTIKRDHM